MNAPFNPVLNAGGRVKITPHPTTEKKTFFEIVKNL